MKGGGVPKCVHDRASNLFRVMQMKGKAFMSGGFGIDMSSIDINANSSFFRPSRSSITELAEIKEGLSENSILGITAEVYRNTNIDGKHKVDQKPANSHAERIVYLFIEEALFLHERGLLEVFESDGTTSMSSHRLFALLPVSGVDVPIYLTYAYLRSQTFVVLRHIESSLEHDNEKANSSEFPSISKPEENSQLVDGGDGDLIINGERQLKRRNRKIRMDIKRERLLRAPPQMLHSTTNIPHVNVDDHSFHANTLKSFIAFDVYNPNSKFRKSHPGPPDYVVAVSHFNVNPMMAPTFHIIMQLISFCNGVPLRIAIVSDSGTVIMFGITDTPVPVIR